MLCIRFSVSPGKPDLLQKIWLVLFPAENIAATTREDFLSMAFSQYR